MWAWQTGHPSGFPHPKAWGSVPALALSPPGDLPVCPGPVGLGTRARGWELAVAGGVLCVSEKRRSRCAHTGPIWEKSLYGFQQKELHLLIPFPAVLFKIMTSRLYANINNTLLLCKRCVYSREMQINTEGRTHRAIPRLLVHLTVATMARAELVCSQEPGPPGRPRGCRSSFAALPGSWVGSKEPGLELGSIQGVGFVHCATVPAP